MAGRLPWVGMFVADARIQRPQIGRKWPKADELLFCPKDAKQTLQITRQGNTTERRQVPATGRDCAPAAGQWRDANEQPDAGLTLTWCQGAKGQP